jgi:hypothetical protein
MWDRYQNDSGGILGDDMVSVIGNNFYLLIVHVTQGLGMYILKIDKPESLKFTGP